MSAELDRTDKAILRQLQRDASLSNVALAEKVHLSPPACLRRVERLKRLGLIEGVVALLNPPGRGGGHAGDDWRGAGPFHARIVRRL